MKSIRLIIHAISFLSIIAFLSCQSVTPSKGLDDFAAKIGISRGALSFYENGNRKPDADIIYAISEKFSVTSDYLLGLTPNKTNPETTKIKAKSSVKLKTLPKESFIF